MTQEEKQVISWKRKRSHPGSEGLLLASLLDILLIGSFCHCWLAENDTHYDIPSLVGLPTWLLHIIAMPYRLESIAPSHHCTLWDAKQHSGAIVVPYVRLIVVVCL